MKRTVTCAGCGEAYSVDLTRYGGKTIKCKRCQAGIAVPVETDDPDGFDVIEEPQSPAGATAPAPATGRVPPSILQRHRAASHKGAVNVALLQRFEDSRQDIRQAFLAVHGSEEARVPQSVGAIDEALLELERKIAADKTADEIEKFKGLLGRLVAPPFTANLFKEISQNIADQNLFAEAVRVVGVPYEDDEEEDEKQAKQEQLKKNLKKKQEERNAPPKSLLGTFISPISEHFRSVDAKAEEEKRRHARAKLRKAEVVKAAIELLSSAKAGLLDEKKALRQQRDKEIAEHSQRTVGHLSHARELMLSGQLAEATLELQGLLPVAPLKLLDDVLLLLSQCSHLSGNASNTARQIQDAICFGASAPLDMDEDYKDLWAKASAGLPKA